MRLFLLSCSCLAAVMVSSHGFADRGDIAPLNQSPPSQPLKEVQAFSGLTDDRVRSVALFQEAGKVIESPRCMNCHPVTGRPTQTDAMTPHQPLVTRGKDGHGTAAMKCSNCHQAENYAVSGVPGNTNWHLAPASMGWQGRSLGQICEQIKDPARNGGKDIAGIVTHMAEDSLVKWAWAPGGNRTPAPGTHEQFGALIHAWAEAGAHCPKD